MVNLRYDTQGSGSYAIYEKKEEDQIDSVVLGMLSNNIIDGCLKFSTTQVNTQVSFRYDITGLETLQDYLAGMVGKKKLLGVIREILKCCEDMEQYMMNISSAVLDFTTVFVEPNTNKVYFLILPVIHSEVPLEQFLKQMIFGVQYDQTEDCSYIANLLSFFNCGKEFNIAQFSGLISKLMNEKETSGSYTPPRKAASPLEINPSGTKPGSDSWKEEPSGGCVILGQEQKNVTISLDPNMLPKGSGKTPHKSANPLNPNQIYPGTISLNPPVQAIPPQSGEKGKKPGMFNRIFGKHGENERNPIQSGGGGIPGVVIPGQDSNGVGRENSMKGDMGYIPPQPVDITWNQVPKEHIGETVDLQEVKSSNPMEQGRAGASHCLVRRRTGQTYFISKDVTSIGRSKNTVDFFITDNTSIGRVHAYLRYQGGRLFVEDHQSKNGTFVNGQRVNGQMEIKAGDILKLANDEFELKTADY